ncbi:MAG TPA: hypothetical protein VFV54_11770 [Thermoanaerobaculia bacterium]|nr:hypothetical protein [Thermoanaerobaculia bacterium]
MRFRPPRLLVLAIALGCAREIEAPPAAPPGPAEARATVSAAPVRTDKPRYAMEEGPFGPETKIVMTFRNPTAAPVYIVNCNGAMSYGLQERIDGTWTDVWSVETNACLSEPIVVPAGGMLTETAVAASGAHAAVESRENGTRIDGGTYRAVWHGVYTSFDMRARPWGEELPIEQRASAPFVIDPPKPPDPSRTSPRERPAEIASIEPAHGAAAAPDAVIRVQFELAARGVRLSGPPQLYLDRKPIMDLRIAGTEDVPQSSLELEYDPPGELAPGRHDARVIYQDDQRRTRWFAWSFTVGDPRP